MGTSNRKNLKRKKKLTSNEVANERKLNVTSVEIFHGLKFQKTPVIDYIKTTTFKSRPNIVFNVNDSRNLILDYSASVDEEDKEILNTFFPRLEENKSTFDIKKGTGEYVNELKSQSTKDLEGSYTFIKFIDGNKILARANEPFDLLDDIFLGKYFIKTPQITIKESPTTKKVTSRLINYTQNPSFSNYKISIGDVLEFKGTKNNNITVTVIENLVVRDDSGREELIISDINVDENTIGTPITVTYYKRFSEIKESPTSLNNISNDRDVGVVGVSTNQNILNNNMTSSSSGVVDVSTRQPQRRSSSNY